VLPYIRNACGNLADWLPGNSLARVRIADVGRGEFEKARRGMLADRRDKRWNVGAL
jgi:hypothetical protein